MWGRVGGGTLLTRPGFGARTLGLPAEPSTRDRHAHTLSSMKGWSCLPSLGPGWAEG